LRKWTKVNIFLSHSNAQSTIAERLALSLRGDGHTVFFDRSDIEPGEEYDSRIRKAIGSCDLFVFLISPESVAPDSYPLAELGIAEERWPHPKGHVLPLVVQPVDISRIPSYLRAVSIFDPQGDFVAEASAAIARIAETKPRRRIGLPVILGAGAVLILAIGAIVYNNVSATGAKREQIARVIAAAATDLEAGAYSDSFRTITPAVAEFPDSLEVRQMQQRAAMMWLRNIRVRAGEQTFTEIVNTLRPVLSSGASAATGQESADLLAHLGWSEYLRSREANADGDPVTYFKRAVAVDPTNPYAHAMWGFWILFNHGSMTDAQSHFATAAEAGRDKLWIRNLQIAALLNDHAPAAEREAIRVANTVRLEKLMVQEPGRLWFIYELALLRGSDTDEFLRLIPAPEHVATFQWLFPEESMSDSSRLAMYRFISGRLQEAAGNRDAAVNAYRFVEDSFLRSHQTGPLLDRAVEGLKRLTKNNASGFSR